MSIGVMLFEQPARTSNKYEMWTRVPDAEVTVVSDREGWGAQRTVVCDVARLPLLGGVEGWTAAPALLRGVRRLDPSGIDVVASHELYSFTTAQAAAFARRHGLPHVVHVSETMPDNPVYRIPPYSVITKRSLRSVTWLVCTTERARQHARVLGFDPERTTVVHSGIDTEFFHPAARLTPDPEVLFIGMLRANRGADKGVRELVAASDLLSARGVGHRLRMVGQGHLREELDECARSRPSLELLGRVPREQIADLLRSARVLVLGSKRTWKWEEQFGFVLAEAMASGLAVVATTCGSIPEIVAPWNPLVAEGDPDALADGIARALGPDGDEWGRKNRTWAVEHFELGAQAERIRGALESAIAQMPRQLPGR
ncbi:MAG: hypothetical protein RI958_1579 [Actinomycetota bacterium]